MILPMTWLWIMLRYLFPRDPLRQGAEAVRHRVVQLVDMANDDNWLQELLTDPAIRLQIELIILDAEDTLRLWIAMRGCQIAGIRLGVAHERAIPNLTRAKDLPELLARIYELLEACEKMEQRAQAHAGRLKRLRDANPLAAHGSPDTWNGAWLRHAAHHEAVGVAGFLNPQSGLMVSSKAMRSMALRPSNHEAVLTPGPPHSIAGANP
jgi:hypothetical protein